MDILEVRSDYLINYEVEDGKIIENYFDNCPPSIVPFTEHNREILERKLAKQWNKFINGAKYKNLLYREKNIGIYNKMFLVCGIVDFYLKPNNIISYINFAAFGLTTYMLCKLKSDLKRPRVTEFCLNNIEKVNEVMKDPNLRNAISFKQSDTFSLNNQHLFSTSDLCCIQNAVKIKVLEDSHVS